MDQKDGLLGRIAPLQLVVIGFMCTEFKGRIISEINRLRDNRMIRIVDALVVNKADNGKVSTVNDTDLAGDEMLVYGEIISWLIGLGSNKKNINRSITLSTAINSNNEYNNGINQAEIDGIISDIPEGGAAAFLLLEHLWAMPLKDAVHAAGGVVITQDFISSNTLVDLGSRMTQSVSH